MKKWIIAIILVALVLVLVLLAVLVRNAKPDPSLVPGPDAQGESAKEGPAPNQPRAALESEAARVPPATDKLTPVSPEEVQALKASYAKLGSLEPSDLQARVKVAIDSRDLPVAQANQLRAVMGNIPQMVTFAEQQIAKGEIQPDELDRRWELWTRMIRTGLGESFVQDMDALAKAAPEAK